MKILIGQQIRNADLYTIENEPISSLDLMERASEELAAAIAQRVDPAADELLFFIGKGNNGGDGLAIARMLSNAGFRCRVVLVYPREQMSEECRQNLDRLPEHISVDHFDSSDSKYFKTETIIIDAILGTGVMGIVRGEAAQAIEVINRSECRVISIDLPSGMNTEYGNDKALIVHAGLTLTIQFPKLAMLLPEAGDCCGEVVIVPIGLSESFFDQIEDSIHFVEQTDIETLIKGRRKFSHKGDFGHALLICGSKGMAGAAILSTDACLRSGCGLVTVHVPDNISTALYASAPAAMVSTDPEDVFSQLPRELHKYSVCGVGSGIGQGSDTVAALRQMLEHTAAKPMVIDADALNIISASDELRSLVPSGSVLTPHPGELRRLIGEWESEEDKIRLVKALAAELKSTIVVKGAYTMICSPDGELYFNSTGTPAMAKGGSGDILTGLITGLVARGYAPLQAAIIGVYIHGLAGEKAAEYYGQESMNSADMIDFLAEVMASFEKTDTLYPTV